MSLHKSFSHRNKGSTNLDALSVFQGTSLGPILFLCFINDLPNATDLFTVLFADDTTGLDSDSNLQNLLTRVSTELTKLADWFRSNRMAINVNKTKYIIFHVPSKKIDVVPVLCFDNNLQQKWKICKHPNIYCKIEL